MNLRPPDTSPSTLVRLRASDDSDERELWDGALHCQIARHGNRLLLAIFDVIDQARQNDSWTARRERARGEGAQVTYFQHHAAIVDAIASRAPRVAEPAMRRHVLALQANLIRATEGASCAAE